MRIFWIRIPKELQWIVAFAIITIGVAIYNNLALIALLVLLVVFLGLFLWWLMKYLDDYQWGTDFEKTIWIVLMVLSLVPGYFSGYIMYFYDESNKYLQEKSLDGLVEIGKFAFSWKRLNAQSVLKTVEKNMVESAKQETAKEMLNSFQKTQSSNIPVIEPNVTVQSWVLKLNPVVK